MDNLLSTDIIAQNIYDFGSIKVEDIQVTQELLNTLKNYDGIKISDTIYIKYVSEEQKFQYYNINGYTLSEVELALATKVKYVIIGGVVFYDFETTDPTSVTMTETLYNKISEANVLKYNGKLYYKSFVGTNFLTFSRFAIETVSGVTKSTTEEYNVTPSAITYEYHVISGGGGTVDYTELENKPKINNVELVGNKTTADLGIDKASLGLGNVDNTSDANKPISTATAAALAGKVSVETGKGLSTNDFTNSYKQQVEANTAKVSNVQSNWNATEGLSVILNKPTLAAVATSGSYNDLSNKPSIPEPYSLPTASSSTKGGIKVGDRLSIDENGVLSANEQTYTLPTASASTLGGVKVGTGLSITDGVLSATGISIPAYLKSASATGNTLTITDKNDSQLIYTPTIPEQVQSNWSEDNTSSKAYIQNKPTLATVATSGSYTDLSNKPTLATVATSGSYNDLSNKPTIPAAQVNSDWNATTGISQILNKPTLSTVATSGSYTDLSNRPTLATVATSGSYTDLSNKPTIPAAQIQSDWNQTDTTALDYIKNKPNVLAPNVDVATSLDITQAGDVVTLTTTKTNLRSGTASTETDNFALANSSNAGMMSPSDVTALSQLVTDVAALKGQTVRLLYTTKTNPTAAEIDAFVRAAGYTDPTKWGGIGVVVSGTYHIWHYYSNDSLWKDDGIDTVTQFTNSYAGVIKGSSGTDGKVYAENDGTGSVYGWDNLVNTVSGKQAALPTTTTAGKILKSTSTSGTVEWGDAPATGVTSVVAGTGLTGGTITSTGTIAIDTDTVALKTDIPEGETNVTLNGTATQTTEVLNNIVVDSKTYTIPTTTVDQSYNASSTNAQSGIAVASAISGKQNTLTAGTGVTISSNTISVNTNTIQEKLTAGTGINISSNTISSTVPEVVANPTAASTVNLNKLQVGSTVYGIVAGITYEEIVSGYTLTVDISNSYQGGLYKKDGVVTTSAYDGELHTQYSQSSQEISGITNYVSFVNSTPSDGMEYSDAVNCTASYNSSTYTLTITITGNNPSIKIIVND